MLISRNPFTEEILGTFEELTDVELENKIQLSFEVYSKWKNTTLHERKSLIKNLSNLLIQKKRDLGQLITLEMGRPILDSISEIEKCAKICEYYLQNIDQILKPEIVKTSASESYVIYEPIGPILAVMPWNFPFSQVLRFAIPAVLSGNVGLLKHASNVPQCAIAIEELFEEAGLPSGVFQNLLISSGRVEKIIRDDRIKGVTLTGSEKAGSSVASIAGSEIKKTVMELGGSDPFIVLPDADLDLTVKSAVESRLKNTGQACNAAKRFVVLKDIANTFVQKLIETFESLTIGDPMDENTQIGPLATESGLQEIENQVEKSVSLGARVLAGGKRALTKGYFYEPTVLLNVKKGMPAYEEELFGPVASVIVVDSIDEAINVANDSRFGLGSSIWTRNTGLAKEMAMKIEAGSVFINQPFSSHPELPFGGVKKSGYGREFGFYGPREFLNVKSVWVR